MLLKSRLAMAIGFWHLSFNDYSFTLVTNFSNTVKPEVLL